MHQPSFLHWRFPCFLMQPSSSHTCRQYASSGITSTATTTGSASILSTTS